jgi:TIR domain
MTLPVPIFCASAHEDHVWLAQWTKHLWPLQEAGRISIWSEAYLLSGQARDEEVAKYLRTAKIVVFLLSADFFADHKCFNVLTQALNSARLGKTRIIPLLLRATFLDETVFGGLAYLPTNGRPVASWSNRDDAFQNCVHGLKQVLAEVESNDSD